MMLEGSTIEELNGKYMLFSHCCTFRGVIVWRPVFIHGKQIDIAGHDRAVGLGHTQRVEIQAP